MRRHAGAKQKLIAVTVNFFNIQRGNILLSL